MSNLDFFKNEKKSHKKHYKVVAAIIIFNNKILCVYLFDNFMNKIIHEGWFPFVFSILIDKFVYKIIFSYF